MAEPPPELIDELYGASLDEFTALRDARAKELRKSDRATADAVKKLRKPSVPAWAVNQLSRRAPDDVGALLAAGAALRQAQLGGGDREAIRSASRDEREAVERLVEEASKALSEAGRGAGAAAVEDVRETLHAAASDEEARELIRRGALTEARQAVGLGGGGFEAAFAAAPQQKAEPKPKQKGTPKGDQKAKRATEEKEKEKREAAAAEAKAKRAADAERKRAAKERAKEAKAALRDAERAVRDAESELSAAERRRDAAQAALDKAERALADA